MRIAFAGNPNSGKTTMYNALTGRNERVGNWAGVTVERKESPIKKGYYDGTEELVAVPEKKVKRITENQPQETTVIREDADLNNINTENDADDILLTRSLSKELGLEKQRPE